MIIQEINVEKTNNSRSSFFCRFLCYKIKTNLKVKKVKLI